MIIGRKACCNISPNLTSVSGGLGMLKTPDGSWGSIRGGRSMYFRFAMVQVLDQAGTNESAIASSNEIASSDPRTINTVCQFTLNDFRSAGMAGKFGCSAPTRLKTSGN